jgi:hypothetical protein
VVRVAAFLDALLALAALEVVHDAVAVRVARLRASGVVLRLRRDERGRGERSGEDHDEDGAAREHGWSRESHRDPV